jgi:hypothetical protein
MVELKETSSRGYRVADPGCLSRIRIFSIPDPYFFHPGCLIRIKEFEYFNLTQKNCYLALENMIQVVHPGPIYRKSGRWFLCELFVSLTLAVTALRSYKR